MYSHWEHSIKIEVVYQKKKVPGKHPRMSLNPKNAPGYMETPSLRLDLSLSKDLGGQLECPKVDKQAVQ